MLIFTSIRTRSLFLLASLFISCAGHLCAQEDDASEALSIIAKQGSVQVFSLRKNAWEEAVVPYALGQKDKVKTGSLSSCEIERGLSRFKVNEDTEVLVENIETLTAISLLSGEVLVKLRSLAAGSVFEIRTPQAVAGTRGTKYKVMVSRDRPFTKVGVLESSVDFTSRAEPDKAVIIKECQEREISPWEKAILTAKGAGILSRSILGEDAGKKASDVFQTISEEEYGQIFGALARVTTKRSAVTDAYRKLAERIYGVVIDSKTTLENFAVKDDTIRTTVHGIVQGAREVKTEYYSDGSVRVVMETEGKRLKKDLTPYTGDVFGIDCIPGPETVTASDFDEFLR